MSCLKAKLQTLPIRAVCKKECDMHSALIQFHILSFGGMAAERPWNGKASCWRTV